ncbi:MAG: AMP-binding protein [Acidimicrobiia bacterium]|nr:AMP-binding protein [Acidimicrobiia bacterium]
MADRGSVGRGIRGTEIRILDADGNQLPPGEVGDIYMQSPAYGGSTYLGASPMPETNDGFATVGDMGWLDDDGYLYLADRRVDMIITGGANVFPAEVETALIDHPDVADVVVIGLPDEEWGQRVHAVIEARDPDSLPTFDDIRACAKERLAASTRCRSRSGLVDEHPRSAATRVEPWRRWWPNAATDRRGPGRRRGESSVATTPPRTENIVYDDWYRSPRVAGSGRTNEAHAATGRRSPRHRGAPKREHAPRRERTR